MRSCAHKRGDAQWFGRTLPHSGRRVTSRGIGEQRVQRAQMAIFLCLRIHTANCLFPTAAPSKATLSLVNTALAMALSHTPASQQTRHQQRTRRRGGSRPPRIARRPRPAAADCMATQAGGSGLEVSSAFCSHAVVCSEIKRCPPPCCRSIQLAPPPWHATSTSHRPRLAGSRAAPSRALPEPGPPHQLQRRHPAPSCGASGQAMRRAVNEAELRLGCSSHNEACWRG